MVFLLFFAVAGMALFAQQPAPLSVRGQWSELPPLLSPMSNNAVAGVRSGSRTYIFSMMGIGPKKTWDAITPEAWAFDTKSREWVLLRPVPGPVGRLAAVAAAVGERVYVFGGYTVDGRGAELTLGNVDIYDLKAQRWTRGADIPVPVDDSVLGVYRNRYVYLIGGWSKSDNVRDVQIYDTEKDQWLAGTPIPGTPVFGHSGGLASDTIIYVDGAFKSPAFGATPPPPAGTPAYLPSDECWMGKIDARDMTRITWTRTPSHPGKARYRMAAGDWGRRIVFTGGTDNPYNFNGLGYDRRPSEPDATTFAWNVDRHTWETLPDNPHPTMDHRGLVRTHEGLVV
ncbi:MAG: galactose oxidase, partial [Acidobacteria bacterium]|nr:galactose oxidase [Acidobacteriota bacterium]